MAPDKDRIRKIIGLIDLTLLGDNDTEADITYLCQKTKTLHGYTAAVCVYPQFVKHARGQLKDTPVKIATVINFPHGTGNPAEYMETAKQALESGADELDFVFPYRDWLNGNRTVAVSKLQSMSALRNGRTVLKIILETGELPDLKTVREISDVCLQTGIDFLKTSTGKTPVSASPEAAAVFLEAIRDFGHPCGIKPSGGIRDYATADRYLAMAETAWGKDRVSAANFRFGASGLLDNLLGGLSSSSY